MLCPSLQYLVEFAAIRSDSRRRCENISFSQGIFLAFDPRPTDSF